MRAYSLAACLGQTRLWTLCSVLVSISFHRSDRSQSEQPGDISEHPSHCHFRTSLLQELNSSSRDGISPGLHLVERACTLPRMPSGHWTPLSTSGGQETWKRKLQCRSGLAFRYQSFDGMICRAGGSHPPLPRCCPSFWSITIMFQILIRGPLVAALVFSKQATAQSLYSHCDDIT